MLNYQKVHGNLDTEHIYKPYDEKHHGILVHPFSAHFLHRGSFSDFLAPEAPQDVVEFVISWNFELVYEKK